MRKERYSQEIINTIRNSIYLPDIINKYTDINRNMAICLFHKDTRPSLSVEPEEGLWHCFGCNAGGDVFKFIMLAEGLTFPNAVKELAFQAGIRLPQSNSIKKSLAKSWEEKQKRIEKVNQQEQIFRQIENEFYAYCRVLLRLLPSLEKRNSDDYLQEHLIENYLDGLDELVNKREKIFKELRRDIRNGK